MRAMRAGSQAAQRRAGARQRAGAGRRAGARQRGGARGRPGVEPRLGAGRCAAVAGVSLLGLLLVAGCASVDPAATELDQEVERRIEEDRVAIPRYRNGLRAILSHVDARPTSLLCIIAGHPGLASRGRRAGDARAGAARLRLQAPQYRADAAESTRWPRWATTFIAWSTRQRRAGPGRDGGFEQVGRAVPPRRPVVSKRAVRNADRARFRGKTWSPCCSPGNRPDAAAAHRWVNNPDSRVADRRCRP